MSLITAILAGVLSVVLVFGPFIIAGRIRDRKERKRREVARLDGLAALERKERGAALRSVLLEAFKEQRKRGKGSGLPLCALSQAIQMLTRGEEVEPKDAIKILSQIPDTGKYIEKIRGAGG